MTISIVTATYNRSKLLPVLYASLLAQNYCEVEWIVVDDGGSDDTPQVIEELRQAAPFPVRYVRQDNAGKQRAVNHGLDLVVGDLVCIVDDDDYFLPNVFSVVVKDYESIVSNSAIAGLSYLTMNPEGKVWGREFPYDRMLSDHYQCRINQKIWGDKIEFTKASILQEHSIRYQITGSTGGFGGDTVFFLAVANIGKTLYLNQVILVKEYRADGISVNWRRKSLENPALTAIYYAVYLDKRVNLFIRLRYMIAFAAIHAFAPDMVDDSPVHQSGNQLLYWIAWLPGKWISAKWKKYRDAEFPLSKRWMRLNE